MQFPNIDPIIFSIGPIAIRWYALAYITGILLGGYYIMFLNRKYKLKLVNKDIIDDFIFYAVLGIILGGRVGYTLFYNFSYYSEYPWQIFFIWQGGMSFHGGIIGLTLAMLLLCRKHKIKFLNFMDLVACASPIGLFFGRLANFANAELYGRPTDVAWGVIFPYSDGLARHPSQLYEAALEGLLLFLVMMYLVSKKPVRQKNGALSGVFLIGYGISRIIVEFFRQPDEQIGYIAEIFSMGQILSLPMIILGVYLIINKKYA
jgi:phosphatidylglycerol:prolipoprotein diacylglycerol transferase